MSPSMRDQGGYVKYNNAFFLRVGPRLDCRGADVRYGAAVYRPNAGASAASARLIAPQASGQ